MTGVAAGLRSGSEQSGVGDRAARPRRAVGADRSTAPAAQAPPAPLSGPPAHRRSRRAGRDRVRAQDRHHLDPAAHRAGWLLRSDVLAPPAGLDRGRRLAGPARTAAGPAARPRRAGPGPLRGRRLPHPRPQRGDHVGPSPVDRGRPGSKHHLIVEAGGIPLAVSLSGGNRNDITQLIPLVDAIPPIRGPPGPPPRAGRPTPPHPRPPRPTPPATG